MKQSPPPQGKVESIGGEPADWEQPLLFLFLAEFAWMALILIVVGAVAVT